MSHQPIRRGMYSEFSLGGVASLNSYAIVPAIADDRFNNVRIASAVAVSPAQFHRLAWRNLLARYFAPGC